MAFLQKLPHLAVFNVGHSRGPLTDSGLTIIANMSSITSLSLQAARITDVGLEAVGRSLKGLRELNLMHCKGITDNGLATLTSLMRLTRLVLVNCTGLTGPGIEALRGQMGWPSNFPVPVSNLLRLWFSAKFSRYIGEAVGN